MTESDVLLTMPLPVLQSFQLGFGHFFDDSPFTIISILTGIHTVGVLLIGFRIILLDHRKYLYRSFFGMCILMFFMLWSNYELMRCENLSEASWFARLQQIFAYPVTAMMALSLWYYARFYRVVSAISWRYFLLFGLFIPAVFFSLLELTQFHYGQTIKIGEQQWATEIENLHTLDWLRMLWTAIVYLACVIYVAYSFVVAKDRRERPIKLLLLVVIFISLSLSLFQNYLVPMFFSTTILNNESFTGFWGTLLFAWAFSDLKLFKIEPRRAVENIMSSMTNLMVLTNKFFQIKDINDAAKKFFKKNINDLQDQSIEILLEEENWQAIKEKIQKEGEQFQKEELEITLEIDGQQKHLLLIITPLMENKRQVGYIFIATDLTVIEQVLEKEKHVAQLQTRFVSIASHQFRTPLTSIKLNTTILKKHLERNKHSNPKYDRMLGRIDMEINRLTDLMNDLLTLGRLENGKLNINLQEHDLVDIVLELLEGDFHLQEDGRKMQLFVQSPPRPVYTDRKIIEHILINLISNAFKYSEGCPAPEIHLYFKANEFKMKIKDYGIGIPEKDQINLFRSFFRGSNTAKIQGSGLGLVIVKELLTLINGRIKYESIEKVGSVFEIIVQQNWDN